jgi:hypothetical protein
MFYSWQPTSLTMDSLTNNRLININYNLLCCKLVDIFCCCILSLQLSVTCVMYCSDLSDLTVRNIKLRSKKFFYHWTWEAHLALSFNFSLNIRHLQRIVWVHKQLTYKTSSSLMDFFELYLWLILSERFLRIINLKLKNF